MRIYVGKSGSGKTTRMIEDANNTENALFLTFDETISGLAKRGLSNKSLICVDNLKKLDYDELLKHIRDWESTFSKEIKHIFLNNPKYAHIMDQNIHGTLLPIMDQQEHKVHLIKILHKLEEHFKITTDLYTLSPIQDFVKNDEIIYLNKE